MAYSTERHVSDGTLRNLTLSIDFIDQVDIHVLFDDVVQDVGTTWAWVDAESHSVVFTPDVPDGTTVLITRSTDLSGVLNVFSPKAGGGGSAKFINRTMDENFNQVLLIAQEAKEGGTLSDVYQDIDMHGYKVVNVGDGDPAAPNDMPNMKQLFTLSAAAGTARDQAVASAGAAATSASASAGSASASAASAVASEASRVQSDTRATASATSATASASSASAANTARTGAQTAQTGAATSATESASSATLASKWAENPEDVPITPNHYSAMHWALKAAEIAQWPSIVGLSLYPGDVGYIPPSVLGARQLALGDGAMSSSFNSVAIGYESSTTRASEYSIGKVGSTRVLANVTTPELATDAATKEYVDKPCRITHKTVAANYTVQQSDESVLLRTVAATGITITVPAGLVVGTKIDYYNGVGNPGTTFVGGAGNTIQATGTVLESYQACTLVVLTANVTAIIGPLA